MNIVKENLTQPRIGIKFGGEIISIECLAGDIVIINESEGDTHRTTDEIDGALRTLKIKRN